MFYPDIKHYPYLLLQYFLHYLYYKSLYNDSSKIIIPETEEDLYNIFGQDEKTKTNISLLTDNKLVEEIAKMENPKKIYNL